MQTVTEKTESKDSNEKPVIEQQDSSKESEQKKQSVDEILTEIINTNKITEDAQTKQAPEETVEPGDAAGQEQSEVEEPPTQETDIPYAQDDAAAAPIVADVDDVAEATATASQAREESGINKTLEAIHKITLSEGDVPDEQETGEIFEAIQRMIQPHADLPGRPSEICANDIMQKQVTWTSTQDCLQQAIEKMQQANTGYIMVGQDGTLEGIVSKSDIAKATSPYLLPTFAKWRRPLDDATLNIRIKWIMSSPVHTIKPQTPLTTIMEQMGYLQVRCLPVLDEKGKVQGLVTAFDIFEALLKTESYAYPAEDSIPESPESTQSEN